MVRKRIPGHLHRTSNRSRRTVGNPQSQPKVPNEPTESGGTEREDQRANLDSVPLSASQFLARQVAPTPAGTSSFGKVRPTQRGNTFRSAPRVAVSPDLQADYDYVVHDLRQIGILTAMAVIVLIGLTFVIR